MVAYRQHKAPFHKGDVTTTYLKKKKKLQDTVNAEYFAEWKFLHISREMTLVRK